MQGQQGGCRVRTLALSMLGGMALPPTPILEQSMESPSSVKLRRPTTTPFSDATTAPSQDKLL